MSPAALRHLAALASGLLIAGPASADVSPFRTPFGNMKCAAGQDFDVESDVVCTILQRGGAPAAAALAVCGPGQGHSFTLRESGPVAVACDPRPTANPSADVAGYGDRAQWGALGCTSSKQGLECRNGDGHGFLLSRGSQRVW